MQRNSASKKNLKTSKREMPLRNFAKINKENSMKKMLEGREKQSRDRRRSRIGRERRRRSGGRRSWSARFFWRRRDGGRMPKGPRRTGRDRRPSKRGSLRSRRRRGGPWSKRSR